jgi:DNA-binding NarL/FixJ family response regulator
MEVVAEAADGEETMRLVLALKPDVLVLDISMPIKNGIEVARAVRKTLPDTRIVVLTGYENRQYAKALSQIGVEGYLSKTASASQLVGAMRDALTPRGAARLQTELAANTLNMKLASMEEPTSRELEVLQLVAQGMRTREIAQRLSTSERTVQFHLANLFGKLAAQSRTEVVHRARQRGWLT